MHSATKHALMKSMQAAFLLLGLASCGDAATDNTPQAWVPPEVPPEILNQPRLVTTPAPVDPKTIPWPRLGDVPSKPKDFTPLPQIQATMRQMEDERADAEAAKLRFEPPDDAAASATGALVAPTAPATIP